MAHNYGSEYKTIVELTQENPELLKTIDGSTVLKAEVIHAIRYEMAFSLQDLVFRRTDLATGGNPGLVALQQCADLAAIELGWTDEQCKAELQDVLRQFPDY